MGSVWRARHLALDAPVAIKFVHVQGGDPERFLARFEREARLAASVRHRNVVSITDYGHMADGTAFMVMDCLEGDPLSSYLPDRLSASEVLYLAELLMRGLVAVHEAGIVHRDLKPENIFVVRDATGFYPKLIDFGISKNLRPEGERRSAVTTQEGAIFGTPAYMSPEQARGLPGIDERTDIYSMGVILYEALSGRLPYDTEYVGDLILAIVVGGAKHVRELRPDLDPRVADLVMKAMAHDARDRFQSAREMLAALATLAPGRGDAVRSDRPPTAGDDAGRFAGVAFADRVLHGGEANLTASAVPTVLLERMRAEASRRRSIMRWAAIGTAGAALTAITLFWAVPGTPPAPASTEPAAAHDPPPASAAPAPIQANTIVELEGVPSGASIRLDGRPAGARIELARGPTSHKLEVSAEGHEPWSRELRADADAHITVALVAKAAAPPAQPTAAGETAKPGPRPSRPARPKSRVITELDY